MQSQYIPRYTYQDYKLWKDDWELIGGYPYSLMPAARFSHNVVQTNAVQQSRNAIQSDGNCNCWVVSKFDWKIDDKTVVKPDMMIICNRPKEQFLEFPPAFVLEILSQSSRTKDRGVKFKLYEEQGVKFYLMADYDQKKVEVYELLDNKYREVKKSNLILDSNCEISFEFDKWWS